MKDEITDHSTQVAQKSHLGNHAGREQGEQCESIKPEKVGIIKHKELLNNVEVKNFLNYFLDSKLVQLNVLEFFTKLSPNFDISSLLSLEFSTKLSLRPDIFSIKSISL